MAALPAGHGEHDRLGLVEETVVDVIDFELHFDFVEARKHADKLAEGAHLPHLAQLIDEVLEVEGAALHLLAELVGVLFAHLLLGFFDERKHVAHAEDPAGEAVRVERFEGVRFFAEADELHRDAGDGANAEGGAAAGVTIHLGEDQAGGADLVVELFGGGDGVLASHRIGHKEDLRRLKESAQLRDLGHHRFINVETPGGIDEKVGGVHPLRFFECVGGDDGGLRGGALLVIRDVDTLGERDKLLDGGRPVDVTSGKQRALTLLLQQVRQLGDARGFAGALEANDHDHGRWAPGGGKLRGRAAEDFNEFSVDDVDNLLGGREALKDLRAERLLLHAGGELADDLEVHVRFEHGHAYFAERLVEVFFGHNSARAELLEGAL